MGEQIALRTESSDFDAGVASLADRITGAHWQPVNQRSCSHPLVPLKVTTDRVLSDDVAALLCEVAAKLGLGDVDGEPESRPEAS